MVVGFFLDPVESEERKTRARRAQLVREQLTREHAL